MTETAEKPALQTSEASIETPAADTDTSENAVTRPVGPRQAKGELMKDHLECDPSVRSGIVDQAAFWSMIVRVCCGQQEGQSLGPRSSPEDPKEAAATE